MRLWLVGCGNMAGAMLSRWLAAGVVAPADVFVANRADRDLPAGVRQGRDLPHEPVPDAVILGVKPQQLGEAAARHGARVASAPAGPQASMPRTRPPRSRISQKPSPPMPFMCG